MYGFSPLVIGMMLSSPFFSTHTFSIIFQHPYFFHYFSAFTCVRKKTLSRMYVFLSPPRVHWCTCFFPFRQKRPLLLELTCCLLRPLRVIVALSLWNMRVRQLVCLVIRLERRARDEWQELNTIPIDEWNTRAFSLWLAKLSWFSFFSSCRLFHVNRLTWKRHVVTVSRSPRILLILFTTAPHHILVLVFKLVFSNF